MPPPSPKRLTLDRLGEDTVVQARLIDGLRVGAGAGAVREPHRHDYHELIWVREGTGRHLIDGEPVAVVPGTVTVIGRGQVHQFEHAEGLRGGIVRFTAAALQGGPGQRIPAGRLLAGGPRAIAVPPGDAGRLHDLLGALQAETRRPPDPYAADVTRHLLGVLLLWLERWHDGSRTDPREGAADADVQLHRRFAELLERDYAAHHDAAHYADALAVPGAALSRALVRTTGRSTKELILDRVMVEAERLLRFTDLTVGEVAYRTGFGDQLYFSRAFKRHAGRSPQAYREHVRG